MISLLIHTIYDISEKEKLSFLKTRSAERHAFYSNGNYSYPHSFLSSQFSFIVPWPNNNSVHPTFQQRLLPVQARNYFSDSLFAPDVLLLPLGNIWGLLTNVPKHLQKSKNYYQDKFLCTAECYQRKTVNILNYRKFVEHFKWKEVCKEEDVS